MPWHTIYQHSFVLREPPEFETTDLSTLKDDFLSHAVALAEQAGTLFFLPGPTGIGKTHALLSLAERLVAMYGHDGVAFTTPTMTINDQTYSFLKDKCHCADAQIYNHVRRETSRPLDFASGETAARFRQRNPFACSYNVTTFNQLLFALVSTSRACCEKAIALRNKVVIVDEFHKFPYLLLPFGFRLMADFCRENNCRFVLGSATPVPMDGLLPPETITAELPMEVVQRIYHDPLIDGRRSYRFVGRLSIDGLATCLQHEELQRPNDNILVIVNLVARGTYRLLKKRGLRLDPYGRLSDFLAVKEGRATLVLDGTVPRGLRKRYLEAVATQQDAGVKVTLISTSMIEVGADISMDYGLIDWAGLNATVQRGGRIQRFGGTLCRLVDVFLLDAVTKRGKSASWRLLAGVETIGDRKTRMDPELNAIKQAWLERQEKFFLDNIGKEYRDTDLIAALDTLAQECQKGLAGVSEKAWEIVFGSDVRGVGMGGLNFSTADYLTDLYGESEWGRPVLLFKNAQEATLFAERLQALTGRRTYEARLVLDEIAAREVVIGEDDSLKADYDTAFERRTMGEDDGLPEWLTSKPLELFSAIDLDT